MKPLLIITSSLLTLLTALSLLIKSSKSTPYKALKFNEHLNFYRDSLDQSMSYDPANLEATSQKDQVIKTIINPRFKIITEVWAPLNFLELSDIKDDKYITSFFSINKWIVILHQPLSIKTRFRTFIFGEDLSKDNKMVTNTIELANKECSMLFFLAGSELFLSQCVTDAGILYQGINMNGNTNFQRYMTGQSSFYRICALSSHDEALQQVILYRESSEEVIHQYISKTAVTIETTCDFHFPPKYHEKLNRIRYVGNSVLLLETKQDVTRIKMSKEGGKGKKHTKVEKSHKFNYYYIPLAFGINFGCGLEKHELINGVKFINVYFHDVFHVLVLEFLSFSEEQGPQIIAMNYNERSSRFEILDVDQFNDLRSKKYQMEDISEHKVYRQKHGSQFRTYIPLKIDYFYNQDWNTQSDVREHDINTGGYLNVISRSDYNGFLDQNFNEIQSSQCYEMIKGQKDELKNTKDYFLNLKYCLDQVEIVDEESDMNKWNKAHQKIVASNVNQHLAFELFNGHNRVTRDKGKKVEVENSDDKDEKDQANNTTEFLLGRIVLIQRPNQEISSNTEQAQKISKQLVTQHEDLPTDKRIKDKFQSTIKYVKGVNIYSQMLLERSEDIRLLPMDMAPGMKIGNQEDIKISYYYGMTIGISLENYLTSSYISRGKDVFTYNQNGVDVQKKVSKRDIVRLQDQKDNVYEGSFLLNQIMKEYVNYEELEWYYSFTFKDVDEDQQVVEINALLIKYSRKKAQVFKIENNQLGEGQQVEFNGKVNEVIKISGYGALLNVEGKIFYLQLYPSILDREIHLSGNDCDKMMVFQPANLDLCLMCFQNGLQTQVYLLWDLVYGRSSSQLPISQTTFFSEKYKAYRAKTTHLDDVIFQSSAHFPNLLFVLYKKFQNLLVVYNIRVNMVLTVIPYKELSHIFGDDWVIADMKIVNEYIVVLLDSERIRLRFFYIDSLLNIKKRKEFDVGNTFSMISKELLTYQPIDVHNSFGLTRGLLAMHVRNDTAHNVLMIRPDTGSFSSAPFMILQESHNEGLKMSQHFEYNPKYRGTSFSFVQKFMRADHESYQERNSAVKHVFFFAKLSGLKMIVDDQESNIDQLFQKKTDFGYNKTTELIYWMDDDVDVKANRLKNQTQLFNLTLIKLNDNKQKLEVLPTKEQYLERLKLLGKDEDLKQKGKLSGIVIKDLPLELIQMYHYHIKEEEKLYNLHTTYPTFKDIEYQLNIKESSKGLFSLVSQDYFTGDILNLSIEPESYFEQATGQIKLIPAVEEKFMYKIKDLDHMRVRGFEDRFNFESICVTKSQITYSNSNVEVCDREIESLFSSEIMTIFYKGGSDHLNIKTSFKECAKPIMIQETSICSLCKYNGRNHIQWLSIDLQHQFVKDIDDKVSGNVKQFYLKVKDNFLILVAQNKNTKENIKIWIYEMFIDDTNDKVKASMIDFEYVDEILLKSDDFHINIFYDNPDSKFSDLQHMEQYSTSQAITDLPIQYLEIFSIRCPVDYKICHITKIAMIKKFSKKFYSTLTKEVLNYFYAEGLDLTTVINKMTTDEKFNKIELKQLGSFKHYKMMETIPKMICNKIDEFIKIKTFDFEEGDYKDKSIYRINTEQYQMYVHVITDLEDYTSEQKKDFVQVLLDLREDVLVLDALCQLSNSKFKEQNMKKILQFNLNQNIIVKYFNEETFSFNSLGVSDSESADSLLRYPKLSGLQASRLWRYYDPIKLIVTLPNYHSILAEIKRLNISLPQYTKKGPDRIFHTRPQIDYFTWKTEYNLLKITNIFMGLQPNYVWYPEQHKWLYLVAYNFKNQSFVQYYNISDISKFNMKPTSMNHRSKMIIDINQAISPFWVSNFSLIQGLNFKEVEGHPSLIGRLKVVDKDDNYQIVLIRKASEIVIENLYIESNYINLIANGLWGNTIYHQLKIEHWYEKNYFKYTFMIFIYIVASFLIVSGLGFWVYKNTPNMNDEKEDDKVVTEQDEFQQLNESLNPQNDEEDPEKQNQDLEDIGGADNKVEEKEQQEQEIADVEKEEEPKIQNQIEDENTQERQEIELQQYQQDKEEDIQNVEDQEIEKENKEENKEESQ